MNATTLFTAFAKLAEHDGVAPLNSLPGCWIRQIDDNWTLIINGHREPQEAMVPDGTGTPITVQPFHAEVVWRGWPAGVLTPQDGMLAAHPDRNGANAAHLLRAIRAAMKQEAPG